MERNTKIILVDLLAQTTVGVIVVAAAFENAQFSQPLGGIGILITYVIAAIVAIVISNYVKSSVLKLPGGLLFKSALLSICLWIFGPILVVRVSDAIPDESASDYHEKTFVKPTLKAVKEMGFKKYKWDNYRDACAVKLPDGRWHFLLMNNGYLNVYAQVKEPEKNDTLAWMKTAFLEAMIYLKPEYIMSLNSSLENKDYEFSRINNNLTAVLKLGATNPYEPVEKWIDGETIGNDPNRNKLGNIRIGFWYADQVKRK